MTGVALIAIQSTLTAVLAILLAINAIVVMCKDNPHEKRRRQMEKHRTADNLTPLDARNSLLLNKGPHDGKGYYRTTPTQETFYPIEQQGASQYPMEPINGGRMSRLDPYGGNAPYHARSPSAGTMSRMSLVGGAAPPGGFDPHHDYTHRGHGY